MTDLITPPRHGEDPREEILINRVVDGEATPADWTELDVVAQRDPSIWARLAEAQRAQASLQRAVEDALTAAELVDLPFQSERLERAWDARIRIWGGWLVAAVLLVAWAGNLASVRALNRSSEAASGAPTLAGLSGLSPDQILQAYKQTGMEDGRVVGEMPMVMLETVPTADGRAQITFVRPLVERVVVDQLYELGQDDAGRAVPVKASVYEYAPGQPL